MALPTQQGIPSMYLDAFSKRPFSVNDDQTSEQYGYVFHEKLPFAAGHLFPEGFSLYGRILEEQEYRPMVCDVEVFDKPRTLVRGTLRASKSPRKLRTLVRRKQKGLFDILIYCALHNVDVKNVDTSLESEENRLKDLCEKISISRRIVEQLTSLQDRQKQGERK
ncbi:hypothetical protein HY450_01780 [Candidatus Pacearchaeota archaeon]|nr:hypothetical protein [Candidatus Pacearchaeota archaeon]